MIDFLSQPVMAAKRAECLEQKRRVVDSIAAANWPPPAASKITLAVSQRVFSRTLSDLPSGIELGAEQLTIKFAAPVELLEKLFALSQALANDNEIFAASGSSNPESGCA